MKWTIFLSIFHLEKEGQLDENDLEQKGRDEEPKESQHDTQSLLNSFFALNGFGGIELTWIAL